MALLAALFRVNDVAGVPMDVGVGRAANARAVVCIHVVRSYPRTPCGYAVTSEDEAADCHTSERPHDRIVATRRQETRDHDGERDGNPKPVTSAHPSRIRRLPFRTDDSIIEALEEAHALMVYDPLCSRQDGAPATLPWPRLRDVATRHLSAAYLRARHMLGQPRFVAKKRWQDLSPKARRFILIGGAFEVVLKIVALVDLARRPTGQVRGSKLRWAAAIIVINAAGAVPMAYLVRGRHPR